MLDEWRYDRDELIRARCGAFQVAVLPSCMHAHNVWCIRNCGVIVWNSYAQRSTPEAAVWPWFVYMRSVWCIQGAGVTVMSEIIRGRFDAFKIAVWPICMTARNVSCIGNSGVNVWTPYAQCSTHGKRGSDRDVLIRTTLCDHDQLISARLDAFPILNWPLCMHTRNAFSVLLFVSLHVMPVRVRSVLHACILFCWFMLCLYLCDLDARWKSGFISVFVLRYLCFCCDCVCLMLA